MLPSPQKTPYIDLPFGSNTYPKRPHPSFDLPVMVPANCWPMAPVNVRNARWNTPCVIVAAVPSVGMDCATSGSTLDSVRVIAPVYASNGFTRMSYTPVSGRYTGPIQLLFPIGP